MTKMDYLKLLVDEIHSTTVATIGSDGHPQTRIIDMMYYDEEGVYFLTAKGKAFYDQLMEQQYVAISATKEKIAVSLRGRIKNIGKKNLDIMFERNPWNHVLQVIFPAVFRIATLDIATWQPVLCRGRLVYQGIQTTILHAWITAIVQFVLIQCASNPFQCDLGGVHLGFFTTPHHVRYNQRSQYT